MPGAHRHEIKVFVLAKGQPAGPPRPALEPPYDPEALCLLMEHSNSLRQNVEAYATNIDGFGHRLGPAIDFESRGGIELRR